MPLKQQVANTMNHTNDRMYATLVGLNAL